MKKTLRFALLLCVSFLTVNCQSFDWEARPYVGDSVNMELINADGETIKCEQPAFDEMTCFDSDNIAELKTAIDRVKMSKEDRVKLDRIFKKMKVKI